MRCAKTTEPIEMQFGIESVGFRESHIRWGCRCPQGMGIFGVSGGLESIVKRRGWVKGRAVQNKSTDLKLVSWSLTSLFSTNMAISETRPILMIYTSYDVFLHRQVLFGSCNEAAPHLAVKSSKKHFGGVNRYFQVKLGKY